MSLHMQTIFLQTKITKFWALLDKLKASVGHIWAAGCMLCMPD
jgi:hypothetical protein